MLNTKTIPIIKVPLNQLRFLWHKDYDLLTQPRHPPLALPGSLLLRPQYWQTFWSLTIPPKAFTSRFHLLHGYNLTAALQHAWNPSLNISPLCRLCQQDTETSFHLFSFTADEIWSVLISFVTVDEQTTVDTGALCFFGAGISTIWKYH
ncbi:hypothetical protein RMATCC62417_00718 [Rhizopus microsporus]|nr:hypothetical protein RMATCC62417_00718 [Rhizopus microsporus]